MELGLEWEDCFNEKYEITLNYYQIKTKIAEFLLKIGSQEIDLACAAYTGSNGRDAMELAVYITGDGYNILEKYPAPERALNGIFQVFSLKVSKATFQFKNSTRRNINRFFFK